MWDVSDMLNPSVYLSKKRHNEKERLQMIKGRVFEAKRISSRTKHNPEVYPYLWYKYQDSTSEFLSHVSEYYFYKRY